MEITIKINGRFVSVEVSAEVADYLEQAKRDRLVATLREALVYAAPTQARRICAYYLGGLTQQQIADRERVHDSNVCLSIRRGLCNQGNCMSKGIMNNKLRQGYDQGKIRPEGTRIACQKSYHVRRFEPSGDCKPSDEEH